MTNTNKIISKDIDIAFGLYDSGARVKDGDSTGDPKSYVVRNPATGKIYPAKKIWAIACYASGKEFESHTELKDEKTGFPGLGFELLKIHNESFNITWDER